MQPELNALIVAARRESSSVFCGPWLIGLATGLAYAADSRLDVGNTEVHDDVRHLVTVMKTAAHAPSLDPGVLPMGRLERPAEQLA